MSSGPVSPGDFGRWMICVAVAIGIIAVVYVMAGVAGIAIPSFIITILWICLAVVICVVAIRFLMRMMR